MEGTPTYLQNSVRLCGSSWSTCGYCHGDRSSIVKRGPAESSKAYTVLADSLTPFVYEAFVNRGWRRSGRALYRPDNWVSCCPAYTIRLQVDKFQPTKRQRKLQRQADNLLTRKMSIIESKDNASTCTSKTIMDERLQDLQKSGFIDDLRERTTEIVLSLLNDAARLPPVSFKLQPRKPHNSDLGRITLSSSVCAIISGKSKGAISRSELVKRVAEELARTHAVASFHSANGVSNVVAHKKHKSDSSKVQVLSVEAHEASGQILVQVDMSGAADVADDASTAETDTKHSSDTSNEGAEQVYGTINDDRDGKLIVWWSLQHPNAALPSGSPNFDVTMLPAHESALIPEVHRLYFRYQHEVHHDADPFAEGSTITSEPSDTLFGWAEKAPQGWLEQAKSMLHNQYKDSLIIDTITESFGQFYSFLVDNPFGADDKVAPVNAIRLGTYHQLYRIWGSLVAVGVVDVLPGGLSSVYLFYDPSFARDVLPLGKFAILKEIEWTLQNKLKYYYLGYYIDSCPKMRYKADYYPSEILCPVTLKWVAAEEGKAKIAKKSPTRNCCQLSQGDDDGDTGASDDSLVTPSQLKLEVGMGQPAVVDMLLVRGQDLIRPLLEEFIRETGPQLAPLCTINFV
jgi:arginine-tRNA-protein transferase